MEPLLQKDIDLCEKFCITDRGTSEWMVIKVLPNLMNNQRFIANILIGDKAVNDDEYWKSELTIIEDAIKLCVSRLITGKYFNELVKFHYKKVMKSYTNGYKDYIEAVCLILDKERLINVDKHFKDIEEINKNNTFRDSMMKIKELIAGYKF